MRTYGLAGLKPSTSTVATLFVVTACLLVLGINGWRSMSARQQQLAETKTAASNLARAVSQHANDTLRIADTALIGIVRQAEANGQSIDTRPSMHKLLMRLTQEIPLLDKLTVMDDQGRWLANSQQFMRKDLTSEFREYFIYHRDNRNTAAFVGPPLRDRTTGTWVVTLSRRINDASGQFAGVAVASVSLAYFQRFHERFDIGKDGAVILMLAEGKVLTRRPAVENLIGKNIADRPLYRDHLSKNSEGNALLTAQQDGVERIYGYVRLSDFPLIAVAALSKDEVLQPWRADTLLSTAAVTGLVLLLEFLGFRLVRQIRLQAQTESALAASEFRWKNALESTGDAVWDLEHRSGTVKMSKEWSLLMGYPPDEPSRKLASLQNLIHPDDRPDAIDRLERYLRGETSEFVNTQRMQTRDGQWKWLLTRGMVVARDADGQPLRTLGTHTDISEQKAQEERLRTARDALEARVDQRTVELRHNNALLLNEVNERRRAEHALQESELRWKFALEGAGDGIWDWDIPGRKLHTSRRWRAMLGYGDEDATESVEAWREHIHPDDVDRVSRMALDAARGRIPAYHAELRRRGRNGAWTWVLDRGTVVSRDIHGKPLRMIGTTIDITERKVAALELSRINRALQMLGRCNEALLRSSNEATLLQQACHVIREVGGYRMAWVGHAEQDARRSIVPVAHAGDEQDRAYLKQLKMSWSDRLAGGRGPAGKAIRSGQPSISGDLLHDPDYAGDPAFAPWLAWVEKRGYRSVFCLPLRDGGRAFGVLAMYSDTVQPATAEETRLLQELADNLAYGMLTLRAQEEQRRMQAAVLKIAAGVSSSTGKQFFEQLCRNITDALHAQAALAIRLQPEQPGEAATVAAIVHGELIANCGFAIAGSPCDALLRQGTAADGRQLEGGFPAGSALAQLNGLSCMGALLKDGAGKPVGMLLVLSERIPPASDFGISTLRIFAARAAMELEREEAAQRIGAQASLLDKAQDAIIVRDLQHGIHFWNDGAARLFGWSAGEAVGKSIATLLYADPGQFHAATGQVMRDGEWRGEIVQQRKDGSSLTVEGHWTLVRDDAGQPKSILAINTDVTERNAAHEKIQRLAYYDPLTRLPNRTLLRERLQALLATHDFGQSLAALFFIDLDNFKTLNDSVGHDQGDLLLQLVAQRLSGCVGAEATVARLGGDEFVILLPGLAPDEPGAENQAAAAARRMIEALNAPYRLTALMHHSTVSIGITLIMQQSDTVTELLKRADLAMYRAKNAGKNTLRLFTPEMQQAVTARAALEADLRQALVNDEFILHYQPQVDADSRVMGAEALVRWRSPARGLVSPALFIPLAEESGLIPELGRTVLEAACAALARWAELPAMAHLSVAVNVSARQFLHPEFVAHVLGALSRSGADPHRLKLELTESVIIEEVDTVIDRMSLLKSHGVMFSLDDFGTGYSSLAYLKQLPLDQLKIDQSFVRDVLDDANDAAIVRSIIALGHSLGLTLIAEGVETAQQRNFLATHGCPAYQGYLFSKPLPLAEFEAYCVAQATPAAHFA